MYFSPNIIGYGNLLKVKENKYRRPSMSLKDYNKAFDFIADIWEIPETNNFPSYDKDLKSWIEKSTDLVKISEFRHYSKVKKITHKVFSLAFSSKYDCTVFYKEFNYRQTRCGSLLSKPFDTIFVFNPKSSCNERIKYVRDFLYHIKQKGIPSYHTYFQNGIIENPYKSEWIPKRYDYIKNQETIEKLYRISQIEKYDEIAFLRLTETIDEIQI